MKVNSLFLNLTSENPARLITFYRDVVGLEPDPSSGEFAFHMGDGATLGIDGHSDTRGQAKEPSRVLIDLMVDDIVEAENELKGRGVSFFRSQGREFWGGIISSFEDPDGNYVQIIQYDPSAATVEPQAASVA